MLVRNPHTSRSARLALPLMMRWGFGVVVAGGVVDAGYHLMPRRPGLMAWAGLAGHLVTLIGMVIVMVGVLSVGLRNRHP